MVRPRGCRHYRSTFGIEIESWTQAPVLNFSKNVYFIGVEILISSGLIILKEN